MIFPKKKKKDAFKVFAKDNIDISSGSSTETMNYQRTSFLLIQMHYEE